MTRVRLRRRQRQLLSEARGAEVLARGAPPPERVGVEEEVPGVAAVRKRELRGNASVASHPVSAATTQADLIYGLGPSRRLLCKAGRRLAQN